MDKYYTENKEKMNRRSSEYQTEKRKEDPMFKMKCNIRRRIRNMNLTNKPSTLDILGGSYEMTADFIANSFQENMSWNNYGEWHIDHIVPLKSAKTDKDKIRLMHYTNLQALWAKDNLNKGSKIL